MMNIRALHFLVLAVAAGFVFAGCAGQVVEAPPAEIMMDPDAPVTEAPGQLGVGTVRTYNNTVNGETVEMVFTVAEIKEFNGVAAYFQTLSTAVNDPGGACDGADSIMEDVATFSYAGCLKDGQLLAALSPNDGRYKWPLQVGKTWRARYQWIDKVLNPDWSGPSWQQFAVVAWEEVTVPAGTFMAYKVVRTNGNWDTVEDEEYITWYAPEPEMIVKVVATRSPDSGYGASDASWELVGYDLK